MKSKSRFLRRVLALSLILISVSIFLTSAWIISPWPRMNVSQASPDGTTFFVDPASIVNPALTPGSTFTVDVTVLEASFLYSWQVYMSWDEALLEVSDVVYGGFLADQPEGSMPFTMIEPDYCILSESTVGSYAGIDGDGLLVTVTFSVKGTGETVLAIDDPIMTKYVEVFTPPVQTVVTDFNKENGYFSNVEEVTHTLTVDSDPISGIDFTVDGTTHTTPWSDSLSEGAHTIAMPSTWTVGSDVYSFDHWEDASTDPTRVITLTADLTVTAYYVLAEYWTLTVDSDPIDGVEFTLDGVTKTTPYSESLAEDSYTLVMPSTWTVGADVYEFDHWEDASTDRTRTISLTSDKTVTAYYEYVPETHTLTVISDPMTGVEFTVNGITHTTPWSDSLTEGIYTIVMPSTWDIYDFDHWDDMSTDPTRTVSLTADVTITAYYVKRHWTLNVASDPFDGVEFTLDGVPHTTPWSDLLDEGSYAVVMPSTWTVGLDVYSFDHWEDMSTTPTRTVSLTADMTVTAYYVLALKRYELVIDVVGSGTTVPSPDTYLFDADTEVIVAATPDPGWMLDRWELDGTNVGSDDTYTVLMNKNHTLIAFFVELPPTHQLNIYSDPISGVEFTLDGATPTTPYSESLAEDSYTVVMPSTWTVGADVYEFDHWEDASTDPTRVISLTADLTVTAYYVLAPKYWTLTVDSDPISGVEFTLDGVTQTTPYSDSLLEDSYTLVMPSTWDIYDFDHWEDMSTDPTRVISLTSDLTVTAYYMVRQWTLNVISDPIDGVSFTIDGVTHTTPWPSPHLDEGSYTVVMPSSWTVGADVYNFDHWEDMSTNPTRTIFLTADMTVTAYYVLAPKYWTLAVDSDPISGIDFTVDGTTQTTPWSDSLSEGAHTIVMPSTWTVGADVYEFDHWEDASTDPTRTVTLTSDMAITAYYTLAPVPETVVAIDPSISTANPGEYFTVNVTITDVTDLYSWAARISWPAGLLSTHKDNITEGPFLKLGGTTSFTKKAYLSYIDIGSTLLGAGSASGSGTLATITFKVLDSGNCTIKFDPARTTLYNSAFDLIDRTLHDGVFYTTRPVARFTYTPHPMEYYGRPIVGETVTFDGTLSYDPDEPYDATPGGILSYEWDFGDDTTGTGSIATHVYNESGSFTVTLTVIDDEGESDIIDRPIIGDPFITIQYHDIAVINVTVTPTTFTPGATLTINVTVLNKGSVSETLNVTVYKDFDPVKTVTFFHKVGPSWTATLHPGKNGTTTIEWDTTGISPGTYTIKVYAFLVNPTTKESVPGIEREEVLPDNWMTFGTITVVGPDFELTASPAALSIPQGGSDTSTITVTSLNDFSDLVALSVSGEPFEVIVTLDPKDVTPPPNGAATSTLTVSVGIAATPGSYILNLTGTTGTLEHSIDITLEITELPPIHYQLTISVVGSGTTNPPPGIHPFDEGTEVVVDALPASGWMLDHWELDGVDVGDADPYTVLMDTNHTLTAFFSLEVGWIEGTVTDADTGLPLEGATVSANGLSDVTDPSGLYSIEASLGTYDVTAEMTGYVSQTVHSVEVAADETVTQDFALSPTPVHYQLTISVVGSGTTNPPPGIHPFDEGTEVVVDALPASGWMLDHWELDGVDVGDADPYTVLMDDDHILIAFFVEAPVEQPPVASFTYSPTVPATGETVTFDASASYDPDGIIVSYEWGFGDGATGTGEIVTHIYVNDGTYTVTLTVTDNDGLSDTTSEAITVLNMPPVAIFSESATTVFIGEVIYFNADDSYDPDGSIVSYLWDFGDGTNATGVRVEHAYADEGEYTVTLTVTDDDGATDTATATKTVLPPGLQYQLTIEVVGSGTADPPPDTYTFDEGTNVTVRAIPDPGWMLDHWLLDGVDVGDADPYTVEMDANHILTAIFVEMPATRVYVYPPTSSAMLGETFTIDVRVADVVNLYSWQVNMSFDPSVLGFVNVTEGDFLKDQPEGTYGPPPRIEVGWIFFGWGTVGKYPGVSGSGTLATVEFLVLAEGESVLDIDHPRTKLLEIIPPPVPPGVEPIREIPCIKENGYFFTTPIGDVTPPKITINEPTAKDYLHSETVTLDFSAIDTESGVASISATLNGMTVESGDTIELFTLSLGTHTFTVTAVDNAGNSATETVEFNIIATIDSLIGLVEKFYELGYIDKKDVKMGLLDKLYAANKKIETGKPEVAKRILNAFMNQLRAQMGKHVTVEAAKILQKDAQSVIDNL